MSKNNNGCSYIKLSRRFLPVPPGAPGAPGAPAAPAAPGAPGAPGAPSEKRISQIREYSGYDVCSSILFFFK